MDAKTQRNTPPALAPHLKRTLFKNTPTKLEILEFLALVRIAKIVNPMQKSSQPAKIGWLDSTNSVAQ
jgi:hypothetical protein